MMGFNISGSLWAVKFRVIFQNLFKVQETFLISRTPTSIQATVSNSNFFMEKQKSCLRFSFIVPFNFSIPSPASFTMQFRLFFSFQVVFVAKHRVARLLTHPPQIFSKDYFVNLRLEKWLGLDCSIHRRLQHQCNGPLFTKHGFF